MFFDKIKYVYFLGIGGIGMSALARYFNKIGKKVWGYDLTQTALTDTLEQEGIAVHFTDDAELIPDVFKNTANTDECLLVFTPAIPQNHKELNYFKAQNRTLYKRAEVLGMIANSKPLIAIAGTHGKTTVTTFTSHLLMNSGLNFGAFLGGISKNYGSNFIFANQKKEKEQNPLLEAQYIVVEADEFDRSFLKLNPQIAVITSTDADHLDIYGNHDSVKEAFSDFAGKIVNGGYLILKKGAELNNIPDNITVYRYSLNNGGDFYARNFRLKQGFYTVDIVTPDKVMEDVEIGVPGLLNIENAIAAVAVACLTGIPEEKIKTAVESFRGVNRRFDFQIKSESLIYIDDYAHHPEELRAFISSVKELFDGKKVTGIFQPHLYTRTRDFADEFAKSLSLLDEVILLEIYPAREEPIAGVNSQMLLDKITSAEKYICEKDKLIDFLGNRELEVLLTMGAGNIDKMVEPIKTSFEKV